MCKCSVLSVEVSSIAFSIERCTSLGILHKHEELLSGPSSFLVSVAFFALVGLSESWLPKPHSEAVPRLAVVDI